MGSPPLGGAGWYGLQPDPGRMVRVHHGLLSRYSASDFLQGQSKITQITLKASDFDFLQRFVEVKVKSLSKVERTARLRSRKAPALEMLEGRLPSLRTSILPGGRDLWRAGCQVAMMMRWGGWCWLSINNSPTLLFLFFIPLCLFPRCGFLNVFEFDEDDCQIDEMPEVNFSPTLFLITMAMMMMMLTPEKDPS